MLPQIEEQMTPTEKAAVEKVHKQLDRLTMARQQVNKLTVSEL